jgi:C4-type Zn-finger protein
MIDAVMEASCPICLRADELPSMVPVDVPHAMLANMKAIVICRDCAFAIADCVEGVPRTPAPELPEPKPAEQDS